jgi:hypothetical protein
MGLTRYQAVGSVIVSRGDEMQSFTSDNAPVLVGDFVSDCVPR